MWRYEELQAIRSPRTSFLDNFRVADHSGVDRFGPLYGFYGSYAACILNLDYLLDPSRNISHATAALASGQTCTDQHYDSESKDKRMGN